MTLWFWGSLTAFWFGLLASLGPCTLATNLAALSLFARLPSRYGALFAAGRAFAYLLAGSILTAGLSILVQFGENLQHWGTLFLGPICVLIGMALFDMLPTHGFGSHLVERLKPRVHPASHSGAFALGLIFSLAVCPICAALFFGSLLPLAIHHGAIFLYPAIFGLGNAAPVAVLAFAGQTPRGDALQRRVANLEHWARGLTATLFIIAGVVLSFEYIFEIHLHP
jgi:cytochrome c-type biogenesis protein